MNFNKNTTMCGAGLVLFLEEDHYVAEDFIHILRLMERTCRASCDRCNILSLGTYLKTYNYYGDSKKVSIRHEALTCNKLYYIRHSGDAW